jgi:hypothetical protein
LTKTAVLADRSNLPFRADLAAARTVPFLFAADNGGERRSAQTPGLGRETGRFEGQVALSS